MPNRKRKNHSIVDVAKRAGVSVTTASRVFNNSENVNEDTRQRVLDAAKALNFSLSTRRPGPKPRKPQPASEDIILFLHFINPTVESADENFTLLPIKDGVNRAARDAGVRVVYDILGTQEQNLPIDENQRAKVIGVLLLGGEPSPELSEALRSFPCCRMMTAYETPKNCDEVRPDHREVGAMAARYLMDKGHHHIAMLSLDSNSRVHHLRVEGFRHEVSLREEVAWSIEEITTGEVPLLFQEDEAALDVWIRQNFVENENPPTALFVDSDRTLRFVYSRMTQVGILPARPLEILSCNNLRTYKEGLPTDFLSIDVHFETVGRVSVAQLLWRRQNRDSMPYLRTLIMPDVIGD